MTDSHIQGTIECTPNRAYIGISHMGTLEGYIQLSPDIFPYMF